MASITPAQLDKLRAFVEDQPGGWQIVHPGDQTAAVLIRHITDEYAWRLRLDPDDGTTWKARCWKGLDADAATSRIGSLKTCTEWLHNREQELQRESRTAHDLDEFAAGRQHWRFIDHPKGNYYAGRHFDFGAINERFLLVVFPYESGRYFRRLRAQISQQLMAGPETSHNADTIDEVTDWVNRWENLMEIPAKIEDCDLDEATELVGRLSSRDVTALTELLDIPGSAPLARRRLVEKFCRAATRGRSGR